MSPEPARQVEYLSAVSPVSMGDEWFEIASLSHFWIKRRFEVLRKLAPRPSWTDVAVAEVGCGTGLIQRQMEDAFGITVDGFDLNVQALRQNVSRASRVCCYNIFDRRLELQGRYDVILLCDVLEHIDDTTSFLDAVAFHLKEKGRLLVNVPADQSLYSSYDRAVGHIRRYSIAELRDVLAEARFQSNNWTYWGLPLIPLLHIRKWLLQRQSDEVEIMRSGFKPPSSVGNSLLGQLSRIEILPQRWKGASLMAVAEKV
ncbi:MAG: class I SAM-dependent methyltransferase [Verrucomicrobiaceae bacterium]|nr:MAG: class I SAM-dependent methyltransferase [Verrucomicrobiaceae bacterium]